MRVLVTGATGFIGSHLCTALCRDGHEVTAAVRAGSNRQWLADLPIRYAQVDLFSGAGLAEATRDVDAVFHVAGLTRAHGRRAYHLGNQLTTRNVLRAYRQTGAPGGTLIYISSLAAAGPAWPGRARTEADPPCPTNYYGTSKLAAEREVLAFGRWFPVTIIRPPAVYGPRDTNMISLFAAAAKGFVLLPNGGRAPVSLVHVDDLVRGLLLALEHPRAVGGAKERVSGVGYRVPGIRNPAPSSRHPERETRNPLPVGGVYYVSGQTTTMREVGALLAEILGRRLRFINAPPLLLKAAGELGEVKWFLTGRPQIISRRKVRDLLEPSWAVSDRRAREELGYRPQITLRDGLAATLTWYRQAGWT